MGRDLFRRKIVILLFFLSLPGIGYAEYPEWLGHKSLQHASGRLMIPPRQGHIGPMVFVLQVPFTRAIHEERALFEYEHNKTELNNTIQRSLLFRKYIMKIIEERNLPPELFFVPFVESNFNPNALSWAGAAGLWQIMDFNAKNTGLVMNEWQDQRYDFWESTIAAFKLLESLYNRYHDWYLALAAYNCGGGALDRAIKKAGTGDFFELVRKNALPKETAHYVPRILAVASLVSYAGRNGYFYSWNDQEEWTTLSLTSPVDLLLFAEKTGIPEDIIKKGNAGLSYRVTPPESGYSLKIPVAYKTAAKSLLESSPKNLVRHSLYMLRSGDTLYSLSKHYKIPIDVILFYNPHISISRFPVGETILVPFIKNNIKAPDLRRGFSDKAFTGSYRVKKGDTLFSIAAQFHVTVEELAYKNKLKLTSVLNLGDTLNVPVL